ncbi:uncharacterized protein LOC105421484 [Amborella trichopoda]|uniref:uncharacterized protein LOC105421484 n=1 Tax=Amborella trichopoda TaxID=13333 RepID=UPI0009BFD928|nr:uncharacterized protein LOC105421484 [Amborella trichopoda]|eukprot:XP_020529555.1 uncharacterized protein LOC105421484 [Amborella trichopoda]
MIVEQYAARFAELSRYVPHIVNTEAWKAAKFVRGLWLDIRDRMMSANLKSYAPMVDFDLKIERDCEDHRSMKEGRMKAALSGRLGKTPRQVPRREVRKRPYQLNPRTQKNSPGGTSNDQRSVCTHCGKDNRTAEDCYRKKNVCLRYGKLSHSARNCSMMKTEDRLQNQGRVFALTEQEAKVSTSIIRGTLSICDVKARALIDPGSSHSFPILRAI